MLQRFLDAQQGVFDEALAELRSGRKRGHWMWYVFPQLKGLGRSATSRYYGLRDSDEARAYQRHPVLGERLRLCTSAVNALRDSSAERIFGYPDTLKFHSCMTLFAWVAGDDSVYAEALRRYFGGETDSLTLELLAESPDDPP